MSTFLIIGGIILGVILISIAGIWLLRRIRARRIAEGKPVLFPGKK